MIQEITGGLYTNESMTYILTKCAKCGREFKRYPGHIYKRSIMVDGVRVMEYFDRPSCWPASGFINEGKYDDEKIRQQTKKSQEKIKVKDHEARSKYRAAHRAEINAAQNYRYTAGTTQAEEFRLERNRKARVKKQQKVMKKWEAEQKEEEKQ